jgi:phosphopantetheinyl transferase (holo-ACP synthase)
MEKILELNVESGKILERDMSKVEFDKWQMVNNQIETAAAEAAAKEAARAALLDKLGITADEAKLLLG